MHIILYIVLTLSIVHAQSIEKLIELSLEKHPSLQTIEQRLSQMNEKIAISQNISNPELSLTINDMPFDDFFSRDIEPMQYQAINFKQKFPWFGKLDAQKTYLEAQRSLILNSYESAKVKLAEEIRMNAYTLKEIEERITILNTYKAVAQQNIKLYTSYASTQNSSHTNSMSASLMLSKIKVRIERYKAIRKIQKAKLKYLVQENVHTISNTLLIKKPKSLESYLSRLHDNPNYHMTQSQKDIASANQTIQDLNIHPDPYVKVGYFNRQDYPDYASITVGFSLPLYGTEKLKSQQARKEVLAASSASLDFKSSLESEIAVMYAKLTEAYMIYTIIENESLPQLEHMFELTQSGIQSGGNLFAYTNLLEQKLALEEEYTSIKAEYLRTQARLTSLIGEL
ncbi:MAG: TolC family protein [Campylobacterota bacterium]|nr:TolC family protein [Campylobacterota bacterium]